MFEERQELVVYYNKNSLTGIFYVPVFQRIANIALLGIISNQLADFN